MKIRILLISLLTSIIFIGCSGFKSVSDETYAQTHSSYYYDANIYIDYDFDCAFCYYEMYWCYNCQTYHVHINHWCHNHYYWYNNWYVVYHYYPHAYYYGHYNNHYYYRDVNRYYVRDVNGKRHIKNTLDNTFGIKEYKSRNNNEIRNNNGRTPDIKKKYNDTYIKQNTQRENKTYQKPNNVQRHDTQNKSMQKNLGRNDKKR